MLPLPFGIVFYPELGMAAALPTVGSLAFCLTAFVVYAIVGGILISWFSRAVAHSDWRSGSPELGALTAMASLLTCM
jgi:hypothetical protein